MGVEILNQLPLPGPTPAPDQLRDLMLPRPNIGAAITEVHFGYLGESEDLSALIASDSDIVSKLNLTHDQIAAAIEALFLSDEKAVNGNPILRQTFIASPRCPWGDFQASSPFDGRMIVREIFLFNKEKLEVEGVVHKLQDIVQSYNGRIPVLEIGALVGDDIVMVLSDLHPHLIRDHKFFEGKGTPYRVDPVRLLRYLGEDFVRSMPEISKTKNIWDSSEEEK